MSRLQNYSLKYGPWALVTGAARGLGTEFSRQIGALGLNVVLVDMIADELMEVAEEVRSRSGVEVKTIVTDLAYPGFMKNISPKQARAPNREMYQRDRNVGR